MASRPTFKSSRAQIRLALTPSMPCYQGAGTVPSSSDGSSRNWCISKASRLPRRRVQVCSQSRMTLLPLVSDLDMHYAVFHCALWTNKHSQFVIMTGPYGGQLEEEVCEQDIVHKDLIRTRSPGSCRGPASFLQDRHLGEEKKVTAGDLVIAPVGTNRK